MSQVGFAGTLFSRFGLTDRSPSTTGSFPDVLLRQVSVEASARNGAEHLGYAPEAV